MIRERIAVLFLTPHCNMTCRFCITRDGYRALRPADVLETLLPGLKAAGVGNVIFGGGEPLSWPYDLAAAAAGAKSMGFQVQVGTNGISLHDGLMRCEDIDRFILPLEAARPEIHNALRSAATGHHAIVLARMAALASLGRPVTLSTVVTRKNVAELPELADLVRSYARAGGILHAWHLYRFLPQGRGGGPSAAELDLARPEYDAACAGLRTGFPGLPILKRPDMTRSATVGFFWMEGNAIRCHSPYPVPAFAGAPAKSAADGTFWHASPAEPRLAR